MQMGSCKKEKKKEEEDVVYIRRRYFCRCGVAKGKKIIV